MALERPNPGAHRKPETPGTQAGVADIEAASVGEVGTPGSLGGQHRLATHPSFNQFLIRRTAVGSATTAVCLGWWIAITPQDLDRSCTDSASNYPNLGIHNSIS